MHNELNSTLQSSCMTNLHFSCSIDSKIMKAWAAEGKSQQKAFHFSFSPTWDRREKKSWIQFDARQIFSYFPLPRFHSIHKSTLNFLEFCIITSNFNVTKFWGGSDEQHNFPISFCNFSNWNITGKLFNSPGWMFSMSNAWMDFFLAFWLNGIKYRWLVFEGGVCRLCFRRQNFSLLKTFNCDATTKSSLSFNLPTCLFRKLITKHGH